MEVPNSMMTKLREDDEQTLTELSSAHRRSQANQLVQTSYIKRIKLFLFGHIINILLTELGRSVWENLDLGHWYRPRSRFSHTDLPLG